MKQNDTSNKTVRDTATVTVKKAVDGTKKRRRQATTNVRRAITTTLSLDDCDPEVVKVAKRVRKAGQVFVIKSPTEILVING